MISGIIYSFDIQFDNCCFLFIGKKNNIKYYKNYNNLCYDIIYLLNKHNIITDYYFISFYLENFFNILYELNIKIIYENNFNNNIRFIDIEKNNNYNIFIDIINDEYKKYNL